MEKNKGDSSLKKIKVNFIDSEMHESEVYNIMNYKCIHSYIKYTPILSPRVLLCSNLHNPQSLQTITALITVIIYLNEDTSLSSPAHQEGNFNKGLN